MCRTKPLQANSVGGADCALSDGFDLRAWIYKKNATSVSVAEFGRFFEMRKLLSLRRFRYFNGCAADSDASPMVYKTN